MSVLVLIFRGLRFHWRIHASVFVGVLLASAILTGALLVGDSVDHSLREIALARLGRVQHALYLPNRYVAQDLANALRAHTRVSVAGVLQVRGMAIAPSRQANQVHVIGIDARFGQLAPHAALDLGDHEVVLNRKLGTALGVTKGGEIALRVIRPSLMPRDAPLSSREKDEATRARFTVAQVLPDTGIGRYSLAANQAAPYNAFVRLDWLQEQVGLEGRINTILVGEGLTGDALDEALGQVWQPEHIGLRLREHPSGVVQLETGRVFLDKEAARAALAFRGAEGTLAYLVSSIAKGERMTPYSFAIARPLADGLGNDGIAISEWLAEQLGARTGDRLRVAYHELLSSNEFVERTREFSVRRILSMKDLAVERELMPAFPGLSDVESCRDWDIGIPMDEELLKDPANEAYWDEFGQTPKFVVSLEAGQAMWANRFGQYTGVRFPSGVAAEIHQHLRQEIDPAKAGLGFVPVRERALQAVGQAMDFGGLFLGMSFFLIVAALILTGLLFVFGLQQRTRELGLLQALGFRPGQVRRMVLCEAGAVALPAAAAGALAGAAYTRALVLGLGGLWQGAVAHATIQYHGEPGTLVFGAGIGFLCALVTMALACRHLAHRPAIELIEADFSLDRAAPALWRARYPVMLLPPLCGVTAAIAAAAYVAAADSDNAVPAFFGIGSLLLLSGLGFWRVALAAFAHRRPAKYPTLFKMALWNVSRRPGRSMSVAGLLACGAFLVLSVSSMREDLERHAGERRSGTGGFELFAETTGPLQPPFGGFFGEPGVSAIALRVRDGDDASCLNLNHGQTPTLLGVDASALRELGAFCPEDVWALLDRRLPGDTIPALAGDTDTAMWGLKAKTGIEKGGVLTYRDESGDEVRVKLAGRLPMRLSVFQGTVLISEEAFTRLYPSENGFRMFLIDTPADKEEEAAGKLKREFERHGMDVVPAVQRLREFYAVESTYLSMFLVLGGLGVTLGSAGMGVIALRNLLERRGEIAMLHALGYGRRAILRILLAEHGVLLFAGLAIGVLAAAAAMTPAVLSSGSDVSLTLQAGMLLLVVFSSGACMVLALIVGRPKDNLAALRTE